MRALLCVLSLAVFAAVASAQPGFPSAYSAEPQRPGTVSTETVPQLKDVTFRQRLNEQLPLGAVFKGEVRRDVPLSRFFGPRPVSLAFVYYTCPMLCTQVMRWLS